MNKISVNSIFYFLDKDECCCWFDNKCYFWVKCINNFGFYMCSCLSGYIGDGVKSCSRKC